MAAHLGTLPVEIVGKLRSSGVYSYKCSISKTTTRTRSVDPKRIRSSLMAVAATHDLPTLRGYWESGDSKCWAKPWGCIRTRVVLRGPYQDWQPARRTAGCSAEDGWLAKCGA
ncbi:4-alpha-glucanotransferase [Shigella flexneri]